MKTHCCGISRTIIEMNKKKRITLWVQQCICPLLQIREHARRDTLTLALEVDKQNSRFFLWYMFDVESHHRSLDEKKSTQKKELNQYMDRNAYWNVHQCTCYVCQHNSENLSGIQRKRTLWKNERNCSHCKYIDAYPFNFDRFVQRNKKKSTVYKIEQIFFFVLKLNWDNRILWVLVSVLLMLLQLLLRNLCINMHWMLDEISIAHEWCIRI